MPRTLRSVFLLLVFAACIVSVRAAPAPVPTGSDEVKKVFDRIESLWKKESADGLAALLPPKGKVKLALTGLKPGRYRKGQAHALLKNYFAAIEVESFKRVQGPRANSARFKHVFRDAKKDHQETRATFITLDREDKRWVIVEILED
jgi:hypothetical protein